MGLRGRLRRLQRASEQDMVVLQLKGGGRRIFSDVAVFMEMFLCKADLFSGRTRPSEVLDAVRRATPESRQAFEEEYGSIEMEAHIIAGEYEGGWVEKHRLLEEGTVESVRHEGGSEEAERIRSEARQQGPGAGPGAF